MKKPHKNKKYRNKSNKPKTIASFIPWKFPEEIPTYDYLAGKNLQDPIDLEETIEDFIYHFQSDYFLQWEAVVRRELNMAMSDNQKRAYKNIDYSKSGKQILYIDEMPRPKQTWYQILREVVPHLVLQTFKTYEVYSVHLYAWYDLQQCILDEYCLELSCPQEVSSRIETIPADLRHRLTIQQCINNFYGIGQSEEMTLANEPERLEQFIKDLKRCKNSVLQQQLTLEKLMRLVEFPESERKFVEEELRRYFCLENDSDFLVM